MPGPSDTVYSQIQKKSKKPKGKGAPKCMYVCINVTWYVSVNAFIFLLFTCICLNTTDENTPDSHCVCCVVKPGLGKLTHGK